MRMMRDVQRAAAARARYAALLPVNEFEQPIIFGLQAGAEMLTDGGRYGNFSGPEFRRAFEFYVNIFREGLAPKVANTRISNVWQEFERGTFAMYVTGPWNVNEFRQRMSPAMDGQVDDGAAAGAGRAVAGRLRPRAGAAWWCFAQSRAEGGGVGVRRVSFAARTSRWSCACCTSNLPARDDAWEGSGLLKIPSTRPFTSN